MALNRFLLTAFVALLAATPATAAGVDWSYSVTVTPTTLNSGAEPSVGLTGLAGTAAGTFPVGAIQVSTFGVGFPGEGTFDPTVQLFTVDFALTDTASSQSQVLTFQGGVGGTINELGANLQFGFSEPSMQTVTLGDNTYDVALLPFSLLQDASTGSSQPQELPTIMAEVTLHGEETPLPDPPSLETPEPASLTLAGLGVAALGAWASRGRRLRKAERC